MQVGDWATWASAIVSLCALVAAVWAARSAKGSLRAAHEGLAVERARDAARVEESHRAQAQLVAAVPARMQVQVGGEGGLSSRSAMRPAVAVLNRSDLPVYDVEVLTPDKSGVGTVRPGAEVPDPLSWSALSDSERDRSGTRHLWNEVPAGHEPEEHLQGRLLDSWERYGRCAIAFTDTAGARWVREADGELRPAHVDENGFDQP